MGEKHPSFVLSSPAACVISEVGLFVTWNTTDISFTCFRIWHIFLLLFDPTSHSKRSEQGDRWVPLRGKKYYEQEKNMDKKYTGLTKGSHTMAFVGAWDWLTCIERESRVITVRHKVGQATNWSTGVPYDQIDTEHLCGFWFLLLPCPMVSRAAQIIDKGLEWNIPAKRKSFFWNTVVFAEWFLVSDEWFLVSDSLWVMSDSLWVTSDSLWDEWFLVSDEWWVRISRNNREA